MLRKFIKSLISSRGDVFFSLFIEAANNAFQTASVFVDILHTRIDVTSLQYLHMKELKQQSHLIHKAVFNNLNQMFITPIDRGDIGELSGLLYKLTKSIAKIVTKISIYGIQEMTEECFIKNANTLFAITQTIRELLIALQNSNHILIVQLLDQVKEFEENGIEDFRHSMHEIYSGKFDTLTILKLKEVYKSIDGIIELGVSAAELIMQISIKAI